MRTSNLSHLQVVRATVISAVGYPLIALLAKTFRWKVDGYHNYEKILASGHKPIFAFWHGKILPATYFWRGLGIVVMISENFDGEWIARIITRFGYGTARGSTSRGGHRALVQLRRDIYEGKSAGFAVDGPRGPAYSVQPGPVWLASLTGSPILPFDIAANRYWSVNSWDRTQIPKPFSRVAIAIGEPITVKQQSSQPDLETKRLSLELSLSKLSERASQMVR